MIIETIKYSIAHATSLYERSQLVKSLVVAATEIDQIHDIEQWDHSDLSLLRVTIRNMKSWSELIKTDCELILTLLDGTTDKSSEQSKPEPESAHIPGNEGE